MNFPSLRLSRVGARLAAGLALVTLSCAAHASVVWQLHDFAFTDGATAAGSFTWDETLHRPTAWNISTTAGVLAAQTYTDANSMAGLATSLNFLVFNVGVRDFRIGFPDFSVLETPVAHLVPNNPNSGFVGPNGYLECDNCYPYRTGVAGAYLSALPETHVPEPSTAALSILALGLLAAVRRRA